MTKILKDIKQAGIKVHNKLETKVWVKATDPDMACRLGVNKVASDIAKERKCTRNDEIAKKARQVISVTQVRKSSSDAR